MLFFTFISEEKEVELGKFYIPSFIDKFEGLYPEKKSPKIYKSFRIKNCKSKQKEKFLINFM